MIRNITFVALAFLKCRPYIYLLVYHG